MSAPRRKRWRTFSLRSFLILVSLTGISVGGWITMVQPMQRQWESADPFLAAGAEIETRPSNLPWLAKLFLPADRNSNITMIQFKDFADLGEAMKGLKHLPHLERLYLARQRLEDKDIVDIAKLKKLKRLALWGNRLTDASAAKLASLPNLEVLDLKKNNFSWRALLEFQDRPNVDVRHDFKFHQATSAELETMAQLNNQTEELTLQDYAPGAVPKAFQLLPKLNSFTHENWSNFDKADWQAVVTTGNQRHCRFNFHGDAPLDSSGWLAAGQLLHPNKIYISKKRVYFANEKSSYRLSTLGDFVDLKAPEFFSEVRELSFAQNSNVQNFGFLESAKHLYKVRLSQCPQLVEISRFPVPVKRLQISKCGSLRRFTGWDDKELRELSISECPKLNCLEDLGELSGMTRLTLRHLPQLSSTAALEDLNELKSLTLADLSPAFSLSSLPVLKGLTTLRFDNSQTLRNLDGMRKFPALKSVGLSGCSNLEQIKGLEVNDSVRQVYLDKTPALKSLEGLSKKSDFKKLTIEESGLETLEGLDGFEHLEELTLSQCNRLISCGQNVSLPNLKRMEFKKCVNIADLSGIVAPALSDLLIGGRRKEIGFSDVGKLPQFKKLDRLSISNCNSLYSLQTLRGESKIVEASFIDCLKLVDLSGACFESMIISETYMDRGKELSQTKAIDLTPLKDVKKLKLRPSNFSQIKGLESLTELRELDLNSCYVDVNSLRFPRNLRSLRLENDRSVKKLTVARMANLRNLELYDCDIETLDCQNQIQQLRTEHCSKLGTFHGLEGLTKIHLVFPGNKRAVADLSFLSAATDLKFLSIDGYQNLGGFDFLKQTKQLQILLLSWKYDAFNLNPRPIPPDISPIKHCENLRVFILDSCELAGIEAIAGLDLLDLRLGGFHFADLELLRQMQNLEVLEIKECKDLKSLAGIGPKPKLRAVYIEGLEREVRNSRETLPAYNSSDRSWQTHLYRTEGFSPAEKSP